MVSASESFAELTDRLKREREAETLRAYDRVAEKPRRPPLPAPLRLPAGDPRRRPPLVPGERARQPLPPPRKAGSEPDLPPPLFTGILPFKTSGYRHPVNNWRWDPDLCLWIGRCPVCRYRFRADPATERQLEREVAGHATRVSPVYEKSDS